MNKIRMTLLFLFVLSAAIFGFDPEAFADIRTMKISIPSCLCGGTMTTARFTVQRIDGVKAVFTNEVNQSAIITFDDEKTDFEQIRKALQRENVQVLGRPQYLK